LQFLINIEKQREENDKTKEIEGLSSYLLCIYK